jgi:hypothetical protein
LAPWYGEPAPLLSLSADGDHATHDALPEVGGAPVGDSSSGTGRAAASGCRSVEPWFAATKLLSLLRFSPDKSLPISRKNGEQRFALPEQVKGLRRIAQI